jgi:hypothetical protein
VGSRVLDFPRSDAHDSADVVIEIAGFTALRPVLVECPGGFARRAQRELCQTSQCCAITDGDFDESARRC